MLRYLVAATIGVCAATLPALAQSQPPYDNEQIARMRQEADRMRTDAQASAPAPEAPADEQLPADARAADCANCPPPRRYDSVEVVKNSRDVDQSRVINTQSVVNVPPRTKETNKLIVRENETRNVGVVQHNHTIIEKEIRYVKRRAHAYRVQTTYQPVCQSGTLVYWIVRRGAEAAVLPAEALTYGNPCHRPCDCGTTVEAYAPRYAYRQSYSYDVGLPRTVHIPVQAYGAYR
jgi:hypothetical protein